MVSFTHPRPLAQGNYFRPHQRSKTSVCYNSRFVHRNVIFLPTPFSTPETDMGRDSFAINLVNGASSTKTFNVNIPAARVPSNGTNLIYKHKRQPHHKRSGQLANILSPYRSMWCCLILCGRPCSSGDHRTRSQLQRQLEDKERRWSTNQRHTAILCPQSFVFVRRSHRRCRRHYSQVFAKH